MQHRMDEPHQPANDAESLDPEILALLDFEAVPRQREVATAWTPALQREFIARLAVCGSPGRVCDEMGKSLSGMTKLYRSPLAESFRTSWHGAVALARRRKEEARPAVPLEPGAMPPSVDGRRKAPSPQPLSRQVGEGQDEDEEESLQRRHEEARESISIKLRRARRLFLHDIAGCPAKRAAFEILTELPVDWELAAKCMPQADEPWRTPKPREPDLLLAAEAGWLGGEFVHGPDKKAELLAEINEWRAEQGMEPVGWIGESGSAECSDADA